MSKNPRESKTIPNSRNAIYIRHPTIWNCWRKHRYIRAHLRVIRSSLGRRKDILHGIRSIRVGWWTPPAYKGAGSRRRKRVLIQLMARVGAWWTSNGDREDGDEEACPGWTMFRDTRGTRDKHKIGWWWWWRLSDSIDLPSRKTEPVNYCADRAHPFDLSPLARPVSWKNNEATREPASSLPSPASLLLRASLSIYHRDREREREWYFLRAIFTSCLIWNRR